MSRQLIVALGILIGLPGTLASAKPVPAPAGVLLITADGLRWQEVFGGLDIALAERQDAGMVHKDSVRPVANELRAPNRRAARAKLMPFLWNTLSARGVMLGDRESGSKVRVTNGIRKSYPGYSEILVGQTADDVIDGNVKRQNPNETVLEFARHKLKLPKTGAALIGSWDLLRRVAEKSTGSVFINTGYDDSTPDRDPRWREILNSQWRSLTPWDNVRHDDVTFEFGLEYLKRFRPRIMHLAIGEMDDWAHAHRYDRYLKTTQIFDGYLRRLFETLDGDNYFDNTLVLITTDHGRGRDHRHWHHHKAGVEGCEETWAVIVAPGMRATGPTRTTAEVKATDFRPVIEWWMGLTETPPESLRGFLPKRHP